jgi:hypothetical protein
MGLDCVSRGYTEGEKLERSASETLIECGLARRSFLGSVGLEHRPSTALCIFWDPRTRSDLTVLIKLPNNTLSDHHTREGTKRIPAISVGIFRRKHRCRGYTCEAKVCSKSHTLNRKLQANARRCIFLPVIGPERSLAARNIYANLE